MGLIWSVPPKLPRLPSTSSKEPGVSGFRSGIRRENVAPQPGVSGGSSISGIWPKQVTKTSLFAAGRVLYALDSLITPTGVTYTHMYGRTYASSRHSPASPA
jgi:hypothetical protein